MGLGSQSTLCGHTHSLACMMAGRDERDTRCFPRKGSVLIACRPPTVCHYCHALISSSAESKKEGGKLEGNMWASCSAMLWPTSSLQFVVGASLALCPCFAAWLRCLPLCLCLCPLCSILPWLPQLRQRERHGANGKLARDNTLTPHRK